MPTGRSDEDEVVGEVSGAGEQLELWAPDAEAPVARTLDDQERRRLLGIALGDRRLPFRFWDKVIVEQHAQMHSACWTWVASRDSERYGQIGRTGGPCKAHRVA